MTLVILIFYYEEYVNIIFKKTLSHYTINASLVARNTW